MRNLNIKHHPHRNQNYPLLLAIACRGLSTYITSGRDGDIRAIDGARPIAGAQTARHAGGDDGALA